MQLHYLAPMAVFVATTLAQPSGGLCKTPGQYLCLNEIIWYCELEGEWDMYIDCGERPCINGTQGIPICSGSASIIDGTHA